MVSSEEIRKRLEARRRGTDLPEKQAKICPRCGFENVLDAKYCQKCGKKLEILNSTSTDQILTSESWPELTITESIAVVYPKFWSLTYILLPTIFLELLSKGVFIVIGIKRHC